MCGPKEEAKGKRAIRSARMDYAKDGKNLFGLLRRIWCISCDLARISKDSLPRGERSLVSVLSMGAIEVQESS